MTNQPTKVEVPNFTRYGNMKGVAKCRNWGFSLLGLPKVTENSAIRESANEFLLVFHSKYVSILHHF